MIVELAANKCLQEILKRSCNEREQESDIWLRTLVDSLPIDFWAMDNSMRFVMQNDSSRRNYGDLLGKTVEDLELLPEVKAEWLEQVRKALDGKILHYEYERNVDGEKRAYENSVVPVIVKGAIVGIVGIGIDNGKQVEDLLLNREKQARKKAEESLLECETQLRLIIDNMLDIITKTDLRGIIQYVSPSNQDVLGYKPEEVLGTSFFDYLHPEDLYEVIANVSKAITTSLPGKLEYRLRHASGHYLWLESMGSPLFDDKGNIIGGLFTSRDITKRRQTEDALRESEEKYRNLVENLSEGIWVLDTNADTVFVNQQMCGLLGYSSEEIIGKNIVLFLDERGRSSLSRLIEKRLRGVHRQLEQTFIRSDGHLVHSLLTLSPLYNDKGAFVGAIANVLDITERKQMENELKISEEKTRELIQYAPSAIFEIDLHSLKFKDINDVMCQYLRSTREELLTINPFDLLDEEGKILFQERIRKRQAGEQVPDYVELQLKTKDGRKYYLVLTFEVLYKNDRSESVFVIAHDVTERKQAEEALRESEERYRKLAEKLSEVDLRQSEDRFYKIFHNSPDLIAIIRMKDDKFIEINQVFLDTLGFSRDEVIGHTPSELDLPIDMKRQEFTSNRQELSVLEYDVRTKSGKLIKILISASLINLNGEACMLTILKDVTERKRYEQEMTRLDRLNLIAEISAGIAHEIRNPMTVVRGYLQLLQIKEELVPYKKRFTTMIEELDRALAIIAEFLSLAKNTARVLRKHNLNRIITALIPLIEVDAAKNGISINLDLGDIPELDLDEKQIRQLVLNLTRNGIEAMSQRGELTVKTRLKRDGVILSVRDRGKGIAPEELARLGTPFFTTKEKGTGLGLAICYRIAESHNAKIQIKTGPRGTTLTVLFMK